MEYTRFGRGEMRQLHKNRGTDRIIGRMGDFDDRNAFVDFCETVTAQAGRKVEGHEVRVSFDDDELRADRPEDVDTDLGHGYRLAKALAPNSPCDITAHGDGEGGMLHLHIAIANVDETTGRALSHGMNHKRVSKINDELAREWGLRVPGEKAGLWADKRAGADEFERQLGDRVSEAKARAHDMDSFREELARRGVELQERSKIAEDGNEVVGWTYRMRYASNGRTRLRRRAASRLAGEFTREALARHFEADRQNGADEPAAPVQPPARIETEDVLQALADIRSARTKQLRSNSAHLAGDPILERIDDCRADPEATAEQLRKEVEKAREAFRLAKERERYLADHPTSWGYASGLLYVAGRLTRNPVLRMIASYMRSQMLAYDAMAKQAVIDEAKRATYQARGDMWDAEKRERAALRAVEEARGSSVRDRRSRAILEKAEDLEAASLRQRQREKDYQAGI